MPKETSVEMVDIGEELMRRNSTPRMVTNALTTATLADRLRERPSYMAPIAIDPIDAASSNGNHRERRVCVMHKRIPFVFASGEPYGCLRVVIPIILNGDVDAFRGDNRTFKQTYNLTEIPSSRRNPFKLHVTISPSQFSENDVLELHASLPVIVR